MKFPVAISILCNMRIAFPYFTPLQILKPSIDHTTLEVTDQVAKLLEEDIAHVPIALVSVVGPYHSGKSFLLNSLIGRTDVFSVGPKTSPETYGLWICRTDRKTSEGAEIWLLDSEGFFGPKVHEAYDAKIFTVATLLSSRLVYNSVKIIDQQAVNLLEMLTRQAQLFSVKSSSSGVSTAEEGEDDRLANSQFPGFLDVKAFPSLTWVVEDFVQDEIISLEDVTHKSSSSSHHQYGNNGDTWLKQYLNEVNSTTASSSNGNHLPYLMRIFPLIKVHTLFLPAKEKIQLQDLSRLSWDELTPEFRLEVTRLRLSLFEKLSVKPWGPQPFSYTAKDLVTAVHFLSNALKQGIFPELPSLWKSWQLQVAVASLRDSIALFDSSISSLGKSAGSFAEFDSFSMKARASAISFYTQLTRDFRDGDVDDSGESNLRQKLREKFLKELGNFHENVKGSLTEELRKTTENFKQRVDEALKPLPVNPEDAQRIFKIFSKSAIGTYREKMDKFVSSVASASSDWPSSSLPVPTPTSSFSPEKLSAELKGVTDALAEENDMKILSVVKNAATAALKGVEELVLSKSEDLLGASEVREFEALTKLRGIFLFEKEVLQKGDWLKIADVFISHKNLVSTEVDARLRRFKDAHDARLSEWFRKLGDRLLGEFRELKRQIELRVLPTSEEILVEEQEKVKTEVFDRLDEHARRLTDTSSYAETRERIHSATTSEWERLRKKNVELWKVHSDEATQCALDLNKRYRKQNCIQGWICLFAVWPHAHYRRSKEHLDLCLDATSKMPPSMRQAVFDSWYEKDLSKESSEVYKNMIITIMTISIPLVWYFAVILSRRNRQSSYRFVA